MTGANRTTEQEPVKRSRRRWPWGALSVVWALVFCGVAVPVGALAAPLVVGTVTADHGEGSPGAALTAFVFTFEGGQTLGADRLIVPERLAEVGRQRHDYLKAMEADRQATGWAGTLEVANEPTDRAEVHGDRATFVDSYRVRWIPPDDARAKTAGPVLWYTGEPRAWRAEVRRDRTGWRLRSVTIPPWCGGYSHCGTTPAPSLTPNPSPSPDDPLSGARSMLPCAPADPLRRLPLLGQWTHPSRADRFRRRPTPRGWVDRKREGNNEQGAGRASSYPNRLTRPLTLWT